MCKWIVSVFIFGLFLQVSTANSTIVIYELSGTDSAQLGSNTTTLVCDYDYGEDTGVEIKWYYNEMTQISQWVPMRNLPQPMGWFSDLLQVTNNTIRFKEMNKNLTGNYTCKVSSNEGEKYITEPLVAYQPASSVDFFVDNITETLICATYELYPLPIITVTGSYDSESNDFIVLVPAAEDEIVNTEEFLNVTRRFKFNEENLTSSATFVCNVFIPNTNYNETRTLSFWVPGNESTIEYPDLLADDLINSTMVNATAAAIEVTPIESSTTNKTPGDFAMVSCAPSMWLMMVLVVLGSKL